jgi:uncharacterized protein (TIGR02391 family)
MTRALDLLRASQDMIDVHDQLGGPALPMNLLHGQVFAAARPLWEKGQYRHALADAATAVSSLAQARLGRRDISDADLMAQAFTDKEPEKGKSRLRCPGDQSSQSVRSRQQGALKFSMGAFQAIRNPAHHTLGEGWPVYAFEQLAALSIVARWIDTWHLDRYVEPVDYANLNTTAVTLSALQGRSGQAAPTAARQAAFNPSRSPTD